MKNKIQIKYGRMEFRKLTTLFHSFILLIAVTIIFCLCGCNKEDKNTEAKKYCIPDSLLKIITLDTIKTETVMGELTLSGKITFNEEKVVKVYPLASGHVQEVKVALGDYVEAGQLLALVKSADVAGILSDAVAAKNNLTIAEKNLEVTEDLYKSGLASEKDKLSAQIEKEKAQAAFNKSNEILKIYASPEGNLSGYYIKAPISGFIVEKKINQGMEIRSDAGDNLFTISDLKDVWAVANVYETDIGKIQIGYEAEVTTLSYGDKKFLGKIDKIYNVLNPETKVLNVRIKLDNSDYVLKPGMFARIVVKYQEQNKMLAVPKNAVIFDDNKYYVVKYSDKCNVTMQQVIIDKTFGDYSFIKSDEGIKQGDVVIDRYNLFVFTALKKL